MDVSAQEEPAADREEARRWAADHSANHDPGLLDAMAAAYVAGKLSGRADKAESWVIEVNPGPPVMSGRVLAPRSCFTELPKIGQRFGPGVATARGGDRWIVPLMVCSGYGSGCVEGQTVGPFYREGDADRPVIVTS